MIFGFTSSVQLPLDACGPESIYARFSSGWVTRTWNRRAVFEAFTQPTNEGQGESDLFVTTADSRELRIFEVATQERTTLRQIGGTILDWSRNNNYIYFERNNAVYRVAVRRGKLEQVASLKEFSVGPEFWGSNCGQPSLQTILFCLCEKPVARRSMRSL
jgi:hypothetical protein